MGDLYLGRPDPGGSDPKESACSVGDVGLILSWEDPLEEGIGNPLVFLPDESHGQRTCPCPMDRGAWCTTVHGVTG